jgi:Flp pilus assembly protein TadG
MRSKKARRGSTLVMVAIMLVAFVGVGAIASDIGRYYVVTGELQTAADAAALKGAVTLMSTAGSTPEPTVDAAVIAFVASTNRADDTTLTVTADAVQMALWTPGTNGAQGSLSYSLNGKRPNAVTVTLAGAPQGVFAQLLGQMARVNMQRQGTAWIANLGSNCVRPFAMPYLSMYKRVSGNAAATSPAPDLDPAQFTTFMSGTDLSRRFIIPGPSNQTLALPNDGYWLGFNFQGNAGKPGFQSGIEDCSSPKIDPDAANGVTMPGNGTDYEQWALDVIYGGGNGQNTYPGICRPPVNPNSTDAGCYQGSALTPGLTVNSVWGEDLGNGSNSMDFRYVGEFVLVCYYKGVANEICPASATTPAINTAYPKGTIVGFLKVLKSRYITPDDILGNKLSNVQRIILVK